MSDPKKQIPGENEHILKGEIARLNKIIKALMNRAEHSASIQGSDFNLFQTAITLEAQVRRRTEELETALLENEKITRDLRERENNYRLILDNSPVSIHEIDLDGRIISMSKAGLRMLRFKEEFEVQGILYLDTVGTSDREHIEELLGKAYAGKTSHFEFTVTEPCARTFKSCFVPILDKNGSVGKLMGITEDITERKQAEDQVRKFAFYDTLTQLANRRLLNDHLELAMAASKRSGLYGAVMFLDLDNFKPINDTYGHDVGDLLLVEAAHRITRCVREMDTVARFGGDEFVVLLCELDENKELAVAHAGIVAEKLRATLAQPYFPVHQHAASREVKQYPCTASIGVTLFIGHEVSQKDVLKRADMAMYQSKEKGRNQINFFDA